MTTKPRKLTKERRYIMRQWSELDMNEAHYLTYRDSMAALKNTLDDLDTTDEEIQFLLDMSLSWQTAAINSDAKLEIARETMKSIIDIIEAGDGIEVYCDVNPEDCDHCVVKDLINETLAKLEGTNP